MLAHVLAIECFKTGEEVYLVRGVSSFAKKTMEDDWIREPD